MKEHSVYSKGGSLTGSTPETWQEEFICFDVITEFGPQCSAVTEVTAGRKSDLCILSSPKVDKWASLSSQEIKTPQNTENQPSSVVLQTLGSRVGQFQTSIHPPTHPPMWQCSHHSVSRPKMLLIHPSIVHTLFFLYAGSWGSDGAYCRVKAG